MHLGVDDVACAFVSRHCWLWILRCIESWRSPKQHSFVVRHKSVQEVRRQIHSVGMTDSDCSNCSIRYQSTCWLGRWKVDTNENGNDQQIVSSGGNLFLICAQLSSDETGIIDWLFDSRSNQWWNGTLIVIGCWRGPKGQRGVTSIRQVLPNGYFVWPRAANRFTVHPTISVRIHSSTAALLYNVAIILSNPLSVSKTKKQGKFSVTYKTTQMATWTQGCPNLKYSHDVQHLCMNGFAT